MILICLEDPANNALVGDLLECRKHLRGHKTIEIYYHLKWSLRFAITS